MKDAKQETTLKDVHDALREVINTNEEIHIALTAILAQLYQTGERIYHDKHELRIKDELPFLDCIPHARQRLKQMKDDV